ncbi:hypothetical protein COB55_05850 [Candidatus Wolfebacteria bacterium]|nr:MAG: hypothetical protein COB55_05850 [Candidatus Wolfebacteria bacterium]
MKTRYFHGTTLSNYKEIISSGYMDGMKGRQVWQVSAGLNYFWDTRKCIEDNDGDEYENKDEKEIKYYGLCRAYENAQITLAVEREECKAVVFEMDLDGIETEDDRSCNNDSMIGAICVTERLNKDRIINAWVSRDLSLFRFLFLAMTKGNDEYFNYSELTEHEERMREIDTSDLYDLVETVNEEVDYFEKL